MPTQFTVDTVPLRSIGRRLWIDGNTKVSGPQIQPNALSLPAPLTCPGSTPTCRAQCYAHSANSKMPLLMRDRFSENYTTIMLALEAEPHDTACTLAGWIETHCQDVGFRWHVSGDVFSREYAAWIARVCRFSPSVRHWIYTRSFEHVEPLLGARNLSVNLSADKDNLINAFKCRAETAAPGFTYLWTGEPLDFGIRQSLLSVNPVIFPGYGLRKRDGAPLPEPPHRRMICGADFFGQSEKRRCGVCVKCGNPKS